jgi:small subunit ribosomal protein S17e
MGRIKTALIKRLTRQLIKEHSADMKKDFNENKIAVARFIDVPSKKMRNLIAGYVTRLMKAGQETLE